MPASFDPEKIKTFGPRVAHFGASLDAALANLDADHPERPMLEQIVTLWKRQRDAVGDALKRVDEHVNREEAKAREQLDELKREFEEVKRKGEAAVAAGQEQARAAAAPPPPKPPFRVDPELGPRLAGELLARYGYAAPAESARPPAGRSKDIWEDWE